MTSLEDLYIYYCRRCDVKPNSKLCDELRAAYESNGHLRRLDSLDLSTNYVGRRGLAPVLELVRNIPTIRTLDLRNNLLEQEDLELLMKAVARHPALQHIDLGGNNLHDASLGNILHLLKYNQGITSFGVDGNALLLESVARIDDQLAENRIVRAKRERMAQEELDEANAARSGASAAAAASAFRPLNIRAVLEGSLTDETSGGHFLYASWRKNPQYALYLSHASRVVISLHVKDPLDTKQIGFAVMRGNALLRVIECDASNLVAESPFDSKKARLELRLDAAKREDTTTPYILMPFSFSPGRTASFTMVAEIQEEGGQYDAVGTISLEPLESRYDWAVSSVDGAWTVANAGGSMSCPSWRENTYFNVKPKQGGRVASSLHNKRSGNGMATILIVLTKNNDADCNDEKEIGFYVTHREGYSGLSPVMAGSEDLLVVKEHTRATTVTLRLEVPVSNIDYFIIPTTKAAQQLGQYSLSLFSSCELELTADEAPHGWAVQSIYGAWDSARNGGCRRENPHSWVHNPSYEIMHAEAADEDDGSSATASKSTPCQILVSLEVLGSSETRGVCEPAQILLTNTTIELNTFGCSALSSACATETWFSMVRLAPGKFYLIPMTHRAGVHQNYRIRIFSTKVVHISHEGPLVSRLREGEIAAYAEQNRTRQEQDTVRRTGAATLVSPDGATAFSTNPDGSQTDENAAEAVQVREEAARLYITTGQAFTDREFPRAPSSLWLDPNRPNPNGPNVLAWKRATALVPDQSIRLTVDFDVDAITPATALQNEWFWSAIATVATRPDWLARVIRGYSPEYGIAQFSFFATGLWRTVTIDDYVPIDALDEFCYSKGSTRKRDFFIPLVEKAYAKLHRCYDALDLTLTPAISTTEAMRQALMNLTGGVPTTTSLLFEAGRKFVKNGLWETLITCQNETRIIAAVLTKGSPNEQEKLYTGMYGERAYPVLEARLVEGQRLVKLHNPWTCSGTERKVWQGKWADGSRNWTNAIIQALDVELDKLHTKCIWMSFEEFAYYFSEITVIDAYGKSSWVEGGLVGGVGGGSFLQETWVNNPQYALELAPSSLPSSSAAAGPVTVVIGLHQPDGRVSLTRKIDYAFQYDVSMGIGVITTVDNTRRLVHLNAETDSVEISSVTAARDIFFRVTIADPSRLQQLVLMPFATTFDKSQQFFISAWSQTHAPSMSLIMSNTTTAVEGEWKAESAGGSPRCGTWRNNPQFLLFPSETMEVTVILRQRSDVSSTTEHIGFVVLDAHDIRSVLHYVPSDVVLSVAHKNDHAVVGTVRLSGMQLRRGMPYIIVPSTIQAAQETGFTLEVLANRKLQLKPVDPVTNWRRQIFTVPISSAQGSAGGGRNFSSWRNNPQFCLRFPLERQGEFIVAVTNRDVSDTVSEVGVMLLKSDQQWDNGKRRKLVLPVDDILCDSGAAVYHAEPARRVPFALDRREPILLMPYASLPHTNVTMDVSVYCTTDFTVEPVGEWFTEVFEASWDAGRTAGGDRKLNRTWINNPFAALSVIRPTHVTAILLQYPRGPEKPVYYKRLGTSKLYMPPPITNSSNKISIGLDLVQSNEPTFTPIQSTEHTFHGEVVLDVVVPACDTTPYFFVPHSFEPEQDADFKLLVFADQPFQLSAVKKGKQLI